MKRLKSAPIKVLKECVFRAWNDNSYELLSSMSNKKEAKVKLMNRAVVQMGLLHNYLIDCSFFSYHADELLAIVEKLDAGPRVN